MSSSWISQIQRRKRLAILVAVGLYWAYRRVNGKNSRFTPEGNSAPESLPSRFGQHSSGYPEWFRGPRGTALHVRRWSVPSKQRRGVVFLSHGLGEHCGRYAHVAHFLNQLGLDVVALDHTGHGGSTGPRMQVDSFTDFVDDYCAFIKQVAMKGPKFLIGHSMGGNIAVQVANRFPADFFKGVILSGPALLLDPKLVSPTLLWLIKQVAQVCPRFPIDRLSSEKISRDPLTRYMYDNDPLNFRGYVGAHFIAEFFGAMETALEFRHEIRYPLLVLHGGADEICQVSGSQMLLEDAPSADKELRVYPGLAHEIFNELAEDREIVIKDMLAWIKHRI